MGRVFAAYVPTTVLCPLGQHASSRYKKATEQNTCRHTYGHTDIHRYMQAA